MLIALYRGPLGLYRGFAGTLLFRHHLDPCSLPVSNLPAIRFGMV